MSSNCRTKQRYQTKYVKANIDNTQLNIKCMLGGKRNETINPIIVECSKLVQKK